MKPMSPEEKELEEMGAGVSARYREGADAEPSARIDAAILDAARREAARPRVRKWHVPAAVAAVLVLGVSLSLRTRDDFGTLPPPEAPAYRPAEVAKPAAPSLEPQASELKSAQADKQKFDRLARPSRERSERAGRDNESRDAHDEAGHGGAAEADRTGEREASAAQSNAQSPQPAAKSDAQSSPAAPQADAPGQVRPRVLAEEPAAPPPLAKAPIAAPAPEEAAAVGKSTRDDSTQEQQGAAWRTKESAVAAVASARPAEEWIRTMEALLREGKKEEAQVQHAEFRKRYPDYKLPASLQELERNSGASK